MESSQFYEAHLQLGPDWLVRKVETDHVNLEDHVYLEYVHRRAPSPKTGELCPIHELRDERCWRHLDTMQYKTFLHARVPRVRLPDGTVVTIRVPWAGPHSRHSWLFEMWAITLLGALKNQTQTARLLRLSFDQLHHIMERAVTRGLADREREFSRASSQDRPEMTSLSIDEKAYRAGHRFVTVVSDPKGGRVLEITDGRTTGAACRALTAALPPWKLNQITAVSMDMAAAYRKAVAVTIPEAEIVYDKFHLFKDLSVAIDQTRRDEVQHEPLLKRTRFLVLKNAAKRTEIEREKFSLMNELNLKTAHAWRVRENFRGMYEMCSNYTDAVVYFLKWKDHAIAAGSEPVLTVAKRFERHVHGILCFFKYNITSAMAEQLNGKIQQLKVIGKGYRNVERIRIAILFFYGKLNLFPQKYQ
jgi:transposase